MFITNEDSNRNICPVGRFTKKVCVDGSRWQYIGDNKEYSGKWDKKCDIVGIFDGEVKAVEIEQRKKVVKEELGGEFTMVKRMTIPVSVFEKNFKQVKVQNIVAEELIRNNADVNATKKAKPVGAPLIMTNAEIENEIKLNRDGWTEKEIRDKINSDKRCCNGCGEKHVAEPSNDNFDDIIKFVLGMIGVDKASTLFDEVFR